MLARQMFSLSVLAMRVLLWGSISRKRLVILLHATVNLPTTLLTDALGSRVTVPVLLYFGLTVVAAIVVVIWARPKHLSRKHRKQEEEGTAELGVAAPGIAEPTPA